MKSLNWTINLHVNVYMTDDTVLTLTLDTPQMFYFMVLPLSSVIYNYLCNQYLSPLTLWVPIPFRRGVLDATLYDKVCQWLAADRWFSLGTPTTSINKNYRHDIAKILLKVALHVYTITLTTLSTIFLFDFRAVPSVCYFLFCFFVLFFFLQFINALFYNYKHQQK